MLHFKTKDLELKSFSDKNRKHRNHPWFCDAETFSGNQKLSFIFCTEEPESDLVLDPFFNSKIKQTNS